MLSIERFSLFLLKSILEDTPRIVQHGNESLRWKISQTPVEKKIGAKFFVPNIPLNISLNIPKNVNLLHSNYSRQFTIDKFPIIAIRLRCT